MLIQSKEAAAQIGIAYQTLRNHCSQHTFPIRSTLQGNRRVFLQSDIDAYVKTLFPDQQAAPEAPRRKRGRPSKLKLNTK